MNRIDAHHARPALLRLARLSALGAASLMLVTACSDYTTTGSGGTGTGPNGAPAEDTRTGGSGVGSGGGGLVATPSGGSNATTGGPGTTGGPESRTGNNPIGPTLMVPTGEATSGPSGPAVPRNEAGTPKTAGSGAAVATTEALNPAGVVPVTRVETPTLPTPTPTPTPAP
jgi:hypothetical protein